MAFTWRIAAPVNYAIGAGGADNLLLILNAHLTANSGAAGATWEVASYVSSSPKSLLLRRKDGSAGRIVLFGQAGGTPHTSAVLAATPGASLLYIGYSATSASNTVDGSWLTQAPLTATDYIKATSACATPSSVTRLQYIEFASGIYFSLTNGTSGGIGIFGAGEIAESLGGVARSCVLGSGSGTTAILWSTAASGAQTVIPVTYTGTYPSTEAALQMRIGSANFLLTRAVGITVNSLVQISSPPDNTVFIAPIILSGKTPPGPADPSLDLLGQLRQVGWGSRREAETIMYNPAGGVQAYNGACASNAESFWFVNADL